ncbi:MAG: hypothetical protein ACFFD4_01350 [Candidatus Odinarchaeota archaeon]
MLEPEDLTKNMEKVIEKEVTVLKKEYGDNGLRVETIGFRTRDDGQSFALIKFSFFVTDQ